jgi:hypothetical protein
LGDTNIEGKCGIYGIGECKTRCDELLDADECKERSDDCILLDEGGGDETCVDRIVCLKNLLFFTFSFLQSRLFFF